jgi:hypothetical protein
LSEKLSAYDKETIISFNEGEHMASIFTYNKTWQKHLEKRLGLKPTADNGCGGKEYEISKERIRPPRALVKLSTETRARLADRLHQNRDFASESARKQAKSDRGKQKRG